VGIQEGDAFCDKKTRVPEMERDNCLKCLGGAWYKYVLISALFVGAMYILSSFYVKTFQITELELNLHLVYLGTSGLSLIGSTATIVSFVRHKQMHHMFHLQLVFGLAICDWFLSSKFMLDAILFLWFGRGYFGCPVLGFIGTTAYGSVVLWNAALMINLFLMMKSPLVYRRRVKGFRPIAITVMCIGTVQLGFSLIATSLGVFGVSPDGTCYISVFTQDGAIFLGIINVMIICVFLWGAFVTTFGFISARRVFQSGTPDSTRLIRSVTSFVMCYFSVYFFPTMLFSFASKGGGPTDMMNHPVVLFATALSLGLQGFLNFLLWRTRVFRFAARGMCRCCRLKDVGNAGKDENIELVSTSISVVNFGDIRSHRK
jgi:hypothetical protein